MPLRERGYTDRREDCLVMPMTLPWGRMNSCGCSYILFRDSSGTLTGNWSLCDEHSLKIWEYEELQRMLKQLYMGLT